MGLEDQKWLHLSGASAGVAIKVESRLDLSLPWALILQVLIFLYTRVVMAAGFPETKAANGSFYGPKFGDSSFNSLSDQFFSLPSAVLALLSEKSFLFLKTGPYLLLSSSLLHASKDLKIQKPLLIFNYFCVQDGSSFINTSLFKTM